MRIPKPEDVPGDLASLRWFRYNPGVAVAPKLSPLRALILQAMAAGSRCVYGFRVMQITGLPGGTVYSALRRSWQTGPSPTSSKSVTE
jgi:hypothetical protein